MKNFKYRVEYAGLMILLWICRIVPWQKASGFLGWLAQTVGTRMAMNRKAVRHLQAAFPISDQTAKEIAAKHWNNLGRVMAEFPHLQALAQNHVTFKGTEHLEALKQDGHCGVLFGAHLGNWEVIPHALLHHFDLAMHPVYRAPNNPLVDRKLHQYRSPDGRLIPFSKSRQGMIGMVKALKGGEHLGMLIDQKYNEGLAADFFGMRAMTGTAFIELAQKFECPLVPIRCIRREDGEGFIIEAFPPVPVENRSREEILSECHSLLEHWIREYPSQWLWIHRRWKMEDLQ